MVKQYNQLPQVAFSILLALSLKSRHGYEIMKQVNEDSNGKVKLVPGSLYVSIKSLNEQGLIEEIENKDDLRRRYYKLTSKGLKKLNSELAYYDNTIKLAKQRMVYKPNYGAAL